MNAPRSKSGQVLVFMLLVFTAILLVALVNFDVFTAAVRKNDVQNAGDAAALAAARWQATSLNLEGELNLIHALALCDGETDAIAGINAMQARLAFAGPLAGLHAAQVAARQNHAFDDPEGSALLREHAESLRSLSDQSSAAHDAGMEAYPELWPGAWRDYASMIDSTAADGVAASPGNTRYFDAAGGHTLANPEFYRAVLGRNWCWFFFNAMDLLRSYRTYEDWDPLPEKDERNFANSEIFGLEIMPVDLPLVAFMDKSTVLDWLSRLRPEGTDYSKELEESGAMGNRAQRWYVFDPVAWGRWDAIDPYGENRFPAAGRVKPEYDVDGAAAVVRVRGEINPVSPGLSAKKIDWLAAAKPFGRLENNEAGGGFEPATSAGGYILPCFGAVRLIPVDAARGAEFNTADASWVWHLRRHLRPYMDNGVNSLEPGCTWCDALALWEMQAFRQSGIDWLKLYSGTCRRPGGGPGGRGGSSHGH